MAWNWRCTRTWVSLQACSDLMLILCKYVLFSLKKCEKDVTYLPWGLIKQLTVWWPHRGKTLHHLDFCLSRNSFGDFYGIRRLATHDLSLLKSALVSDTGWSLLRKTRGKMVPLSETRKVSGGSPSTPACCVKLQRDGHLEAFSAFREYSTVLPDGNYGLTDQRLLCQVPCRALCRHHFTESSQVWEAKTVYYWTHCPEETMASEILITFSKAGQDLSQSTFCPVPLLPVSLLSRVSHALFLQNLGWSLSGLMYLIIPSSWILSVTIHY